MILRNSLLAATLLLVCAVPAVAAPVNIDFSFDSSSGTFYGLNDDVGISSASSFDFVGREDVYSGMSTASATCNDFTFDAGGLADICFSIGFSQKGDNATGELTSFAIHVNTDGLFGNSSETSSSGSVSSIEGSASFEVRPVTVMPLPAGMLLMVTGIAAVGGLRFRKKQVAQV